MSKMSELYEEAKDAFYLWEEKSAREWGGYAEWGSSFSDADRLLWCEGYVQGKLNKEQTS